MRTSVWATDAVGRLDEELGVAGFRTPSVL